MALTSVTYEGNGSTRQFSVPFPFISRDHVKVFVNTIELLTPSMWFWNSDTQIEFRNAPGSGDAIVIRRVTPGDTRLVDFQNGAVLTEADLDLSATQNFYLHQETKENYAALVNDELVRIGTSQGIYTTDPDEMIASLVDTMLSDAAAADLRAAVTDVDNNAESIIDIQARTSDLEAYYSVTLSVDNYVTGFAQMNDGTTGAFVILADKFGIVDPNTFNQVILWDGTKNLLAVEGNIVVNSGGALSSGKTSASDTTKGFWLGHDGTSDFDFHIGDTGSSLKWDGSAGDLIVTGDITFTNPSGSWTPAGTGFASFPFGTMYYMDMGKVVIMWCVSGLLGTSNATGLSITNVPAAIRPTGVQEVPCIVQDNAANYVGSVSINPAGTLVFNIDAGAGLSFGGFTASGSKGIPAGFTVTYTK